MNLTPEIITAIATTAIATCALGLTFWQIRQNHKHNRLSVKPHLSGTLQVHNVDGAFYCSTIIANNGIGPAIIKNVRLYCNDEEISYNDSKKYRQFMQKKAKGLISQSKDFDVDVRIIAFDVGESLSAGKSHCLFYIKNFPLSDKEDLMAFINSIKTIIDYESIYGGETFTYTADTSSDNNEAF